MLILLIAFSSIGKRVKHSLPASAFVLFSLILSSTPAGAGLLDFIGLDNAKTFYETKDYNNSAQLYENFARQTKNGQAYYNAGNAHYKEKNYLDAIASYSKARFDNKDLRAKNLSNMGNAYVKLGTKNTLQKAVKTYELSLKVKEDKDTRENLEAVKKALKENDEDNKDKSEKNNKDEEKKERRSDEQGEDSDKADDPKNKDSKEKGSKENKKSGDDKKESSGDKQDNKEPQNENGNNSESSMNDDEKKKKEQEKAKELKDENKDKNENKDGSNSSEQKIQQMSDVEQAKWLKQLNTKQNTYLYRLNQQKESKRDENEKPW